MKKKKKKKKKKNKINKIKSQQTNFRNKKLKKFKNNSIRKDILVTMIQIMKEKMKIKEMKFHKKFNNMRNNLKKNQIGAYQEQYIWLKKNLLVFFHLIHIKIINKKAKNKNMNMNEFYIIERSSVLNMLQLIYTILISYFNLVILQQKKKQIIYVKNKK